MVSVANLMNNITAPKQNNVANDAPVNKSGAAKSAFDLTAKKAETSFEDFLFLFTTQLKNQLPDDNVDSSQMLAQLAQFTSVEQQIKGNQLLEKMLSFQENDKMDKATSYLGKTVEINNSSADFDSKPISFSYEIPKVNPSTNVEFKPYYTSIKIIDDKNQVVYSSKGEISSSQKHNFSWNGEVTGTANKAPKGHYRVKIETEDNNGTKIDVTTNYKGTITKVLSNGDKPIIIVDNKNEVDMSQILSVSEPESAIKDSRTYSDPMDYMGKLVKADFSKINLDKSSSLIQYHLEKDANSGHFAITDQAGKFVGSFAAETAGGLHTLRWDGRLSNGIQLKDGKYNLSLSASDQKGQPIKTNLEFQAIIDAFSEGEKVIFSANGVDIPRENIVSVTTPAKNSEATKEPDNNTSSTSSSSTNTVHEDNANKTNSSESSSNTNNDGPKTTSSNEANESSKNNSGSTNAAHDGGANTNGGFESAAPEFSFLNKILKEAGVGNYEKNQAMASDASSPDLNTIV